MGRCKSSPKTRLHARHVTVRLGARKTEGKAKAAAIFRLCSTAQNIERERERERGGEEEKEGGDLLHAVPPPPRVSISNSGLAIQPSLIFLQTHEQTSSF